MHLAERGQLLQSRAPNIGELDSSWASSVHLFGKTDVIPGGLDVVLVKKRGTWVGQDLIYTSSRHYVSAEKIRAAFPHDGLARKCSAEMLMSDMFLFRPSRILRTVRRERLAPCGRPKGNMAEGGS